MQYNVSPLDEIDFYKAGHYAQYPENTVEIYSNFTPRSTRTNSKKVVVAGIQMVLQDIHENWKKNFFDLTEEEILEKLTEYKEFMDSTIYPGAVTTKHIMDVWKLGYLPLEIIAIPEGTLVPVGIPILTIRNIHPSAYWLVNYLETKLSNALWKPITSATTAFQYLRKFYEYADITGADKNFIKFQGHDFSYRGMSGNEDAVSSGLGHLMSFVGTDTVPAIKAAKYYGYGDWKKELVGCSVVATEHSVMCAGSKDGEFQTFERLLGKFPTNVLSVVSDTWDYWQVITDFLPRLKEKIMSRNGRLVIRPDSGDPIDIICGTLGDIPDYSNFGDLETAKDCAQQEAVDELREETPHGELGDDTVTKIFSFKGKYYKITVSIEWNRYDKQFYFIDFYTITNTEEITLTPKQKGTFECLWETFGGTVNEKGYKVLDPHIGLIYGDSITLARQAKILHLLERKGFTADNLVLGIGSFTYEYVTRDTYGMAMKATNIVKKLEDGTSVSEAIFKDPKTGSSQFSKKSAKGYLKVNRDEDGKLKLVDQLEEYDVYDNNEMELVYFKGSFATFTTLDEIRRKLLNHINEPI